MEYTALHKVIGVGPCGCKVIKHPDKYISPFIHYCPLHKSAPDLYEACKEMHKRFIPQNPDDSKALLNLWETLALVEGK